MKPTYTCQVFTGDYSDRQRAANEAGAVCYFEQHLNSTTGSLASYGLALVASNYSNTSWAWGAMYRSIVDGAYARRAGMGRVTVANQGDRGYGNLYLTEMPAIIGEAGFVSSPAFVQWLNEGGVDVCAMAAALSIRAMFPAGGLVALSIGHVGKTSAPDDKGATAVDDGDGDPGNDNEARYAEAIVRRIPDFLCLSPEGVTVRTLTGHRGGFFVNHED